MKHYTITTLPNKVRVLAIPKSESTSVSAMVMFSVGSRQESADIRGIAHFVEHNVFKGTTNRPHRSQVDLEIESIGGDSNAATGHECTYYYANCAPSQANRVLDIVLDISANMIFPAEDIEIERGNVLEEYRLMQDTPTRRLSKGFHSFVFGDQPLGLPIVGTEETIKSITREQMLNFVHQGYAGENIVVVVSGKINESEIIHQVEQFYQRISIPEKPQIQTVEYTEFQENPRVYFDQMKSAEQAHLGIAFKSFARSDERRFALEVANGILGEGKGSRLFRKIRDELGLAYYVGSGSLEYHEIGMWMLYAGVDVKRTANAIRAMMEEVSAMRDSKNITDDELLRAKEYLKGQVLLGVETSSDLASWYGFQVLLENEVLSPDEWCSKLDVITKADVSSVVSDLLVEKRLNVGVLGPFGNQEEFTEGIINL